MGVYGQYAALLLLLGAGSAAGPWTHSWDTVGDMMFVDFRATHTLTQQQATFLATNYAVLSFEGCTGQSSIGPTTPTVASVTQHTEDGIYESAAALKAVNPNVKVLFYLHMENHKLFCYEAIHELLDHPEWWLRDDNGDVLYAEKDSRPVDQPELDYTVPEAREWWTSIPLSRDNAVNLIDGILADGSHWRDHSGISAERNQALRAAKYTMLDEMQVKLDNLNGGQVVGNGLQMYWDPYGVPATEHMDGVMAEHFAVFEQVNADGTLRQDKTHTLIGLIGDAAAADKTVLLSLFPGPVVQPIGNLGPSYPANSPWETPDTFAGRRAALMQWHEYAVAAFLTVAEENVFMTYIWWYPLWDGAAPCPDDIDSCAAPPDWYPLLKRSVGEPQGPAVRDGDVYTREFEFATSVLDLGDLENSSVTWHSNDDVPNNDAGLLNFYE